MINLSRKARGSNTKFKIVATSEGVELGVASR